MLGHAKHGLMRLLAVGALLGAPAAAQETATDTPTGAAIADAIERQFLLDRAVDVNDIDVTVTDGIAELTGSVDNLLAKQRATYIAEMVRGVRAVSNRITVVPEARWDMDIRVDVTTALLRDPATDLYEVGVKAKNGVVVLTGAVDSWAEKRLSERVASGIRGVREVKNEIEVEFKTDRADSELKPEIERRMHWDIMVDDGLVEVAVAGGHVTLSGIVGSAAEKRRARFDAMIAGVQSVDSSGLKVRGWAEDLDLRKKKYAARSDEEIADAVAWAATHDPRVLSFNVEPEVEFGWVTLRGTVSNLKARRVAEQLARHTVGVVGVTNRLKVRTPHVARSDREILFDVRRALRTDPYTESYGIDVDVTHGRVTLSGTVDSFFESVQAADLARRVQGVKSVRSLLIVPGATHTLFPEHAFDVFPPLVPTPPAKARTDEQLRQNIRDELLWSPFVDSEHIRVKVLHGVATLTGTVASARQFHAAARNAYEGGAGTVVNSLRIEK